MPEHTPETLHTDETVPPHIDGVSASLPPEAPEAIKFPPEPEIEKEIAERRERLAVKSIETKGHDSGPKHAHREPSHDHDHAPDHDDHHGPNIFSRIHDTAVWPFEAGANIVRPAYKYATYGSAYATLGAAVGGGTALAVGALGYPAGYAAAEVLLGTALPVAAVAFGVLTSIIWLPALISRIADWLNGVKPAKSSGGGGGAAHGGGGHH